MPCFCPYKAPPSFTHPQRLTGAADNRGSSVQYTLDVMGNRIREEVKDQNSNIALVTARVINNLHRVAAIQGSQGQTTVLGYDASWINPTRTLPMKKIAILVALPVTLWAAFVGGRKSGFQEATELETLRAKSITALNAMGSYVIQADIAKDMTSGNAAKALCAVQVYASAEILQVKQCLEHPGCKAVIESEVQKVAPELLGDGALKIKYFKVGEKCPA